VIRKQSVVSLFIIISLFASVAHANGASGSPNRGYALSVVVFDGAPKSAKKSNGFVRIITAPFRALGRLFGGGGSKKEDRPDAAGFKRAEAGVAAEVAEASQRADAERARKASEQERRRNEKEQKRVAGVNRGSGVETASSATGNAVALPAPKNQTPPVMWKPYIENVPLDHLSQGRALLEYGYYAEAIAELSIAATVGPDLVEANNLLGRTYDRIGAHRHAQEHYSRALSVAPYNPWVLHNLGHSLYLSGNATDALKRLKQAARIAPNETNIVNSIALVQVRLGKYNDALKSFARIEGEFHGRLKLAQALTDLNLPKEAIKQYEAALRIQPQSPVVLEHLADLYQRTGQLKEAEAARRMLDKPDKTKPLTGGGG
jgi:tetratricopeptide (TPR) repeat protein